MGGKQAGKLVGKSIRIVDWSNRGNKVVLLTQMTTHIGRKKKVVLFFIVALLIATSEAILTAKHLVGAFSSQVYTSVKDIPFHEIGLVLGAPKYSDGRLNPVLEERIQAAADLFFAGKVNKLVVSGISRPEKFYDETLDMMQGLIRRGIPKEVIIKDDGAFKTFDSVLHMRDVFNFNNFIIVSQRDHCMRALYIAKHNNISAVGFDAGIPTGQYPDEVLASLIREPLARVKAVFDIAINGHTKK